MALSDRESCAAGSSFELPAAFGRSRSFAQLASSTDLRGEHPIANASIRGAATPDGLFLAASRIDAFAAFAGELASTTHGASVRTELGVAQARRTVAASRLSLLHLVFAPARDRPILLAIARLRNRTAEPLLVRYSELWDVRGVSVTAADGVCVGETHGLWLGLADVSAVIRAQPPDPLPPDGLALDVPIVLPPREERQIYFAYACAEDQIELASLVRAFRGDVPAELARTVSLWSRGAHPDAIDAYRAAYARGSSPSGRGTPDP